MKSATNRPRSGWFIIGVLLVLVAGLHGTADAAHQTNAVNTPAPDQPGEHRVAWYRTHYSDPRFGRYDAVVYYPVPTDGFGVPSSTLDRTYPGIVVANGFLGASWNISWIPQHLASHGYVALVFTPPQLALADTTQWAMGLRAGIDQLKRDNQTGASPIYGIVDKAKFGAIGLSMGGAGVVEAAGTDSDIDVGVGLAPAYIEAMPFRDAYGIAADPQRVAEMMADLRAAVPHVSIPIQLQIGTHDGFVRSEWVRALYELIPCSNDKQYLAIAGASHVGYLDLWICPIGQVIENLLGGSIGISFEEQHRIASRYFTSFFNFYLKGFDQYEEYVHPHQAAHVNGPPAGLSDMAFSRSCRP